MVFPAAEPLFMTEGKMLRESRNGTADLVKGFAVLFMIQVHVMEQFATVDVRQATIGQVSMFLGGPFCAPAFMAVMGYFLYAPAKPAFYYLKRGAWLFAGGILLNIARSANLLVHILQGKTELNGWSFIFGADILTLAGLSLILIAGLRTLFRDRFFLWISLALLVAAIAPPLSTGIAVVSPYNYILAFLWGDNEWSYFPVFPWFSYVLLGYAFRLWLVENSQERKPEIRKMLVFSIPITIILLVTLPWAVRITSNLHGIHGYYHHGILFFLWVSWFLVLYVIALQYINDESGEKTAIRIVKWMGRNVTTIYVIQWLIIGNLATMLFGTLNLLQATLWFSGVTILSVLFTWVYGKTIHR